MQEKPITADGGGSHGIRCRWWKVARPAVASKLGIPMHVGHFPPGTSPWNKIEQRLFCPITQQWCGRPLVKHARSVKRRATPATLHGLTIHAELATAR